MLSIVKDVGPDASEQAEDLRRRVYQTPEVEAVSEVEAVEASAEPEDKEAVMAALRARVAGAKVASDISEQLRKRVHGN